MGSRAEEMERIYKAEKLQKLAADRDRTKRKIDTKQAQIDAINIKIAKIEVRHAEEMSKLLASHEIENKAHDKASDEKLAKADKKMTFRAGFDSEGTEKLMMAAIENNLTAVTHLLATGTPVDGVESGIRTTALHHACVKGHIEVVQILLEAGASVVKVDKNGHNASWWTDRPRLYCLGLTTECTNCWAFGDSTLRDSTQRMRMSRCEHTRKLNSISRMLREYRPKFSSTLTRELITAAKTNDTDTLKRLIAEGANIEGTDTGGNTALHYAGTKETCTILLEAGASVTAQDRDGHDAIWWASRSSAENAVLVVSILETYPQMLAQQQRVIGYTHHLQSLKAQLPFNTLTHEGDETFFVLMLILFLFARILVKKARTLLRCSVSQ